MKVSHRIFIYYSNRRDSSIFGKNRVLIIDRAKSAALFSLTNDIYKNDIKATNSSKFGIIFASGMLIERARVTMATRSRFCSAVLKERGNCNLGPRQGAEIEAICKHELAIWRAWRCAWASHNLLWIRDCTFFLVSLPTHRRHDSVQHMPSSFSYKCKLTIAIGMFQPDENEKRNKYF